MFFVRVTNKGLMLDAASTFDDTVFKAIVFSGGCTVTATRAGNRFGREVGVSVPCVWITLIVGFHKGNIVGAGQERFGQGNGEDCIVGKAAIRTEQIELLGLDVVPLVNRADNVTRYCTDHLELPRKRPCHVENALDCLGIILGGRQLVILIATFEIRIRFAYVSDQ